MKKDLEKRRLGEEGTLRRGVGKFVVAHMCCREADEEKVEFWTEWLAADGTYTRKRGAAQEFTSQVAAMTAADAAFPRGAVLTVQRRKRWLSYARSVMEKLLHKKATEEAQPELGLN